MLNTEYLQILDTHQKRVDHWEANGIGITEVEWIFTADFEDSSIYQRSIAHFIKERWSLAYFCKLTTDAQTKFFESVGEQVIDRLPLENLFEGIFAPSTKVRYVNDITIIGEVIDKKRILVNDTYFTSFSKAANTVGNTHVNGWLYWEYKRPDGTWELIDVKRDKEKRKAYELLKDLL